MIYAYDSVRDHLLSINFCTSHIAKYMVQYNKTYHTADLVQDYSISIANVQEILQFCTSPLIYHGKDKAETLVRL